MHVFPQTLRQPEPTSSLLSYNRRASAEQKVALSGQKFSLEVLVHPTNSGNHCGSERPRCLAAYCFKEPQWKEILILSQQIIQTQTKVSQMRFSNIPAGTHRLFPMASHTWDFHEESILETLSSPSTVPGDTENHRAL